jgi:hypothetical protein
MRWTGAACGWVWGCAAGATGRPRAAWKKACWAELRAGAWAWEAWGWVGKIGGRTVLTAALSYG